MEFSVSLKHSQLEIIITSEETQVVVECHSVETFNRLAVEIPLKLARGEVP